MDDQKLKDKVAALTRSNKFANLSPKDTPAYWDVREPRPAMKRGLDQEFFERSIDAAYAAWMRGKGLSAPAICSEDSGLPINKVRELMKLPRFKDALDDRGIPQEDQEELTAEMVALLALLRDNSAMISEREKCEALGIKYQTFLSWLEYPPFREMYRSNAEGALKRATEMGDAKLVQLIEQGNLGAIKYANEMTGKYRPQDAQAMSVSYVIAMVSSILQKHVTDEGLLLVLSKDLMALATGNGLPAPMVLEAKPLVPAAHEDIEDAVVIEDELPAPEVVDDDLPSVLRGTRGNTDHPVPSPDGGDSRL